MNTSDKVVCLRDYLPGDGKHAFHIMIPYVLTKGKIYCVSSIWHSAKTRGCSGWLVELVGMPMPINPDTGNKFGWPVEWFGVLNGATVKRSESVEAEAP